MASTNLIEKFLMEVGRPLSEGVNLAPCSHFRIGGDADYFFEAGTEEELVRAILFARENDLRHRVIGGGHNLLFDDRGYRGLILHNAVTGIRLQGPSRIHAASGSTLEELMTFCRDQELGGLEFLVGIPGTIGGAVYGNAGAFDQDIGQVLREARLLTLSGEVVRVNADFFAFSYRHSALKKGGHILLEAVLEGYARDRVHIQEQLSGYRKKRENRHPPWEVACAGSYFKNPVLPSGEKVPAAFLLDQIGAKGMTVGDAAVFSGHANFIINQDRANSEQVRELASRLKARVKDRFAVDLEEEVIFLPAGP
jgi:UDP-N-acetylmuramate dehydrogenase